VQNPPASGAIPTIVQGRDVIKDEIGGKLPSGRPFRPDVVRTSARVRVYPADAVLPADRFLPSADAVNTASARTQKKKKKKKKNFFLYKFFW
jgi:hypothetical protein